MSRSILQKEAETNPQQDYRVSLQNFLDKYPGYSFGFEAGNNEDSDLRVFILVIYPDGMPTPLANVALESVPVIKQYLQETGALKLLYEGIRRDTLAELERVREQLGVEAPFDVVAALQDILYLDSDDDCQEFLNPDKEWDSDTLESIGLLMTDAGLVPKATQ